MNFYKQQPNSAYTRQMTNEDVHNKHLLTHYFLTKVYPHVFRIYMNLVN